MECPHRVVERSLLFGILSDYVVSRKIDCYVYTCYSHFEILLDFSPASFNSFYMIPYASAISLLLPLSFLMLP